MNTRLPEQNEFESTIGIQAFLLMLLSMALGTLGAVVVLPSMAPNLAATLLGPDPKAFWYLSRGSAFVAMSLLWLSMALGLTITHYLNEIEQFLTQGRNRGAQAWIVERTGIRVETSQLALLAKRMDAEITSLTTEIYDIASHPFNINSPQQLGKVLFDADPVESAGKRVAGRITVAAQDKVGVKKLVVTQVMEQGFGPELEPVNPLVVVGKFAVVILVARSFDAAAAAGINADQREVFAAPLRDVATHVSLLRWDIDQHKPFLPCHRAEPGVKRYYFQRRRPAFRRQERGRELQRVGGTQ
jgi:hypothetical protein